MYKWQQVKVLAQQGESIKKIARRMKISKNTVRKYLRDESPPALKVRKYEKALDAYKDDIYAMVEKKYIGTRIFNELLSKGYTGSLSAVHRYLQGIRKDEAVKEKATTRFETLPGRQMQYDWKEWNLPIGGHNVRVYFHEVILGYSRKKHYTWSTRITAQDVIRAIEEAIFHFGGVAPELVIDNPRQMVVAHRRNGVVCYSDDFLKFCGLYGIEPNACRPYRARTKGKVERPFYYLEEHFLKGLEVAELSCLDGLLKDFTDRYNARLHSSLQESPDERFIREKGHLRAIPSVEPALLYAREIRKVSNDGYVSWRGNLYPVAMRYCLHDVFVEEIFGRDITVYDLSGNIIVRHEVRLFDKGKRPEHPEHAAINEAYRKKRDSYRLRLINRFRELFPEQGETYITGLKKNATVNLSWHLEEILKFYAFSSREEMSAVIAECIKLGAYHKNTVKRLLGEKEMRSLPPDVLSAGPEMRRTDISRPLTYYRVEASHA